MTGMFFKIAVLFKAFKNCRPFILGIFKSKKMQSGTWGKLFFKIFNASSPSKAVAQFIDELIFFKTSIKTSWSSISSSTRKSELTLFILKTVGGSKIRLHKAILRILYKIHKMQLVLKTRHNNLTVLLLNIYIHTF